MDLMMAVWELGWKEAEGNFGGCRLLHHLDYEDDFTDIFTYVNIYQIVYFICV